MSDKLRENSLSFFESLVLGVAGSGPANAIALAMGSLIGIAGLLSPLYILVFAVPMLGIAMAYKGLNRRGAHAGAAFKWVGQAFGKFNGFMSGWALITAQMIFIISGVVPLSTAILDFINPSLVNNVALTTALSAVWFLLIVGVIMFGIKLTSYLQVVMLSFEIVVLLIIGAAAIVHGHATSFANPFSFHLYSPSYLIHHFSGQSFAASALVVVFLYWGWDVTANLGEETRNGEHAAGNGGLSGVIATIFLYSLYAAAALILFTMAQTQNFSSNLLYQISIASGLGRTGGLIASIAVIFSSAATVQTGMLQVTRTLFAMGRDGALPHYLGKVSAKTQSPLQATYWLIGAGLAGILLTGFMPSVSAILSDGVTASGLQVSYYFGMAGLVSAWIYRDAYRESWRRWFAFSLFPGLSAVALIGTGIYAITTFNTTTIIVGVGTLLAGIVFFRPRRYCVEGVILPAVAE
ncbi:MAG: APC family permease [Rhodospirillales bacterium]|nr:APC family permease [Rhodospirillales bacterium]